MLHNKILLRLEEIAGHYLQQLNLSATAISLLIWITERIHVSIPNPVLKDATTIMGGEIEAVDNN